MIMENKDSILHNNAQHLISGYSNIANLLQDYDLLADALVNYKKAREVSANAGVDVGICSYDARSLVEVTRCYQDKLEIYITLNHYMNYVNSLLEKGLSHEQLFCQRTSDQRSVLIFVSAFNRKKLTPLSLAQIQRYKTSSCQLYVYNDYSTEYDKSFLEPFADKVIQLPQKMGPHNLRWYYFRKFLETDFDFIYMTDNDIIHNPNFITVLKTLYEIGDRKLPICIYNSSDHMGEKTVFYNKNGIMLKKTAPGFSMFFDRKMVEKIVSILDSIGHEHDNYGADYRAIAYLGVPWITSETSYAEHYGAGGINNLDYETDKAINPTPYLQERRQAILQYLTQDIQLEIDF
jgi:hypothetical protein